MRLVHRERCSERVEPHAVDHLSHVFGPFDLVHFLDNFICQDLPVHGSLRVFRIVVELSWLIVKALIKLVREDSVLVYLALF